MEKQCPNCGSHLPQEAVFCGKCGYRIEEKYQVKTKGDGQWINMGIIFPIVFVILIIIIGIISML